MNNKDKYEKWIGDNYVPIYSKPWWMDAVCGNDNWDVWLFEEGGTVSAAMPYFITERNGRKLITKAPLTQNNGIIFSYPKGSKNISRSILEEKVINAACEYIDSMCLDIYEQQYQTSFQNWLPFLWNDYKAITRYTYVINDTDNLDFVWENISSKRRAVIKKGMRQSAYSDTLLSIEDFYDEHEKIYLKQGLDCPFSYDFWERMVRACEEHGAGKMSCRCSKDGDVAAVSFVVWDSKRLYKLMGGPVPEFAGLDAYSALTWDEIELAHKLGLSYDFEGSVIKRISKSYREYGAEPKPYFRIRKVFNPDIIYEEADGDVMRLKNELENSGGGYRKSSKYLISGIPMPFIGVRCAA